MTSSAARRCCVSCRRARPILYRGREDAVPEVQVTPQHEVVQDRQPREQLDVLEGPCHASTGDPVRTLADQLLTSQADRALLWAVHPGDDVEDAALAGPVGSDQSEQLVDPDVEGHAIDGLTLPKARWRSSTTRSGSLTLSTPCRVGTA